MGRYTTITEDAFSQLQLDAGILLYDFDIAEATASSEATGFDNSDIICATTGGIQVVCKPEFEDLAENVDNAPNNMKEMMKLTGWTCTMATTSLSNDVNNLKLALGAADVEGSKVTPRRDLEQTDFEDSIWWVGDRADGGFVAIKLMNVLSSEGFSLQTGKSEKGGISITLQGFVSINSQNVVPMEFYSIDPVESE